MKLNEKVAQKARESGIPVHFEYCDKETFEKVLEYIAEHAHTSARFLHSNPFAAKKSKKTRNGGEGAAEPMLGLRLGYSPGYQYPHLCSQALVHDGLEGLPVTYLKQDTELVRLVSQAARSVERIEEDCSNYVQRKLPKKKDTSPIVVTVLSEEQKQVATEKYRGTTRPEDGRGKIIGNGQRLPKRLTQILLPRRNEQGVTYISATPMPVIAAGKVWHDVLKKRGNAYYEIKEKLRDKGLNLLEKQHLEALVRRRRPVAQYDIGGFGGSNAQNVMTADYVSCLKRCVLSERLPAEDTALRRAYAIAHQGPRLNLPKVWLEGFKTACTKGNKFDIERHLRQLLGMTRRQYSQQRDWVESYGDGGHGYDFDQDSLPCLVSKSESERQRLLGILWPQQRPADWHQLEAKWLADVLERRTLMDGKTPLGDGLKDDIHTYLARELY